MAIVGDVEPVTSREAQVCGLLYTALRDMGALPLNGRAPSVTGVQLHDRFISAVEVARLLRPPYLTPCQVYILTQSGWPPARRRGASRVSGGKGMTAASRPRRAHAVRDGLS